MRLDGTSFRYDPEDPRLDPVLLKDNIHEYVSLGDLEALEKSHTWWDSTPEEMQACLTGSPVEFGSSPGPSRRAGDW